VLKLIDITIIKGHRGEIEQNSAYMNGMSQLMYPDSQHNAYPSMAIDCAPYPIDWRNKERFFYLAGIVIAITENLYKKGEISHKIKWGGLWALKDYVHFELYKPQ